MSVGALALNCRTLEGDVTPASSLRVSCANCDPDNPRGVPRAKCRKCGGTGQRPVALADIVQEIHSSRMELLKGGKGKSQNFDFDD